MAFSFGFSGDDIEEDPNSTVELEKDVPENEHVPSPVPVRSHDLDILVGV